MQNEAIKFQYNVQDFFKEALFPKWRFYGMEREWAEEICTMHHLSR
jgi:hypothetical protein